MIENMRVRTVLVALFLIFSVVYLLPSVVSLPKNWPLFNKKLSYGLDIQGGVNLVYGVDVASILVERTNRMAADIAQEMKDQGVQVSSLPNADHSTIIIKTKSQADTDKVLADIKKQHSQFVQVLRQEPQEVEAKFFDSVIEENRKRVINQAIQVIRNRVDEFGVAEPEIAAEGTDHILVQLPGISDSAQAKELINKTARLSFLLVDTSMKPPQIQALVNQAEKDGHFALGKDGLTYTKYVDKVNEALKSKLPANTMVAFQKAPNAKTMEAGHIPLLLKTDNSISGDLLEDAWMGYGQMGEPEVEFRFGSEGAKRFGTLTGNNIHHQLAIVLDKVVFSAPVIQSRIGAQGQITLGDDNYQDAQKEGQLIATALRAGALPATLQQLEEQTVGPSLGADSITQGARAAIVGLILVILFMTYYYRFSGAVASFCLLLNVLSLLAVLAAMGATLTLPGIAGITLTMGMAIDANVIINERIREELARGASNKLAVRDGFRQAFSAIFDSNVTTAIAGSVLIYFGSGPVRGFGVTLIAGIVTTLITAVYVCHYFMEILVNTFNIKRLLH